MVTINGTGDLKRVERCGDCLDDIASMNSNPIWPLPEPTALQLRHFTTDIHELLQVSQVHPQLITYTVVHVNHLFIEERYSFVPDLGSDVHAGCQISESFYNRIPLLSN